MEKPNGRDPVAVVGIGCRFSDIDDVEELWRALASGRCTLKEVPVDRYDLRGWHDPRPGRAGRIVAREGGFVDDIWSFDNGLFGISHREAAAMDPQHRVLLEVGWRAFEDAGLRPQDVDGGRAAVFVGLFTGDHRDRVLRQPDPDLDIYLEIGSTRSSAAGRLAHAFNLTGPVGAVDAACASSLLAIHLACQSIWSGESRLALAGGSNLVLEPEATVCFSASGMLAADSRCKFGDSRADGFVRSEGAALVVLKPLADAVAHGDRIYAVVRGSGAANDGKQGSGLYMTPSVEGQATLMKRVWDDFGLDPEQLRYVEAHGTGTRAGDPVELEALARAVVARRRRTDPVWVGSVKSNIGHTEGAAGVAGFIKAALVLHKRQIPPTLHVETPNPAIPWEAHRLALATRPVPLDPTDALVAVSSFGLSGTNAHAVLAAGSSPEESCAGADMWILPVSGASSVSLAENAARLADALPDLDLGSACWTAARRRAALSHRAAVVGRDREELIAGLKKVADGAIAAPPPLPQGKVVFVFSGQGGQWLGMGRAMARLDPVFAAQLQRVDAVFQRLFQWSPRAAIEDESGGWTKDIRQIQPLIFTMQVALAETWIRRGIRPKACVGHSLGEVAAAYVSGALDLDDAVRVITVRSDLLGRIAGQGAMAVVGLGADAAAAAIHGYDDRISVAVVNSSASSVLSGQPEAIAEVLAKLEARGVFCRRVDVDVASHSPQTQPLLRELKARLSGIRPHASAIPFFSTVTAAPAEGAGLDADYWARNQRERVRFGEAVRSLAKEGADAFVEMSPHPVLLQPIQQGCRELGREVLAVPAMRRDEHDRLALFDGIGQLWCRGVTPRWDLLLPEASFTRLPPYQFSREAFPVPAASQGPRRQVAAGALLPEGAHPWLGARVRVDLDPDVLLWEIPISTGRFPWLADHRVRGNAVLPGAAYVDLALAAAAEAWGGGPIRLEDVELREVLTVPVDGAVRMQLALRRVGEGEAEIRFTSARDEGEPILHAEARAVRERPRLVAGVNPREAAELARERIAMELARVRANPTRRAAILALDGADDVLVPGREPLASRLRHALRASDGLYPVGGGRILAVLDGVERAEQLGVVANRVDRVVRGEGGSASLGVMWIGPDSPAELAEVAVNGRFERWTSGPAGGAKSQTLDLDAVWEGLARRGIEYGPAFRGLVELEQSGGVHQARVAPPPGLPAVDAHMIHPALFDACLQVAAAAAQQHPVAGRGSDLVLPVGFRRLLWSHRPSGELRCRVWTRGESDRGDELELDLLITDREHRTVLEAQGLRVRRVERPSSAADRVAAWFHRWSWEPLGPAGARPLQRWHLVAGAADRAVLNRSITRRKGTVVPTPEDGAGVLILAPAEGPADLVEHVTTDAMTLLDSLRAMPAGSRRPVWIVTRGVWEVDGPPAPAALGAAALWGLGRVLARERPDLDVHLADLGDLTNDVGALLETMGSPDAPDELGLRGGRRFVHRLARVALPPIPIPPLPAGLPTCLRLAPGGVERVPSDRSAGEAPVGWLLVDGRRAAFAVLDGPPRLVPVRPEADGDAVCLPGLVATEAAVPLGEGDPLAAADAAWTLAPAVLAVESFGRIRVGERVLVLGGDNAVGRHAARLAADAGAEVWVAASSLETRAALRADRRLGVVDESFAGLGAQMLDLTGGEGLDVVLQLGHGPTPRALAPALGGGARLVDLGGAAPVDRGLVRTSIDPVALAVERPRALLGALRAAAAVPGATSLARATVSDLGAQPGTVLLDLRGPAAPVRPPEERLAFQRDGAYLLSGGTGGIGLRLGAWMAERGAGCLLLLSRSGRADAEAIARIEAAGTRVHVLRADVADAEALGAALAGLRPQIPPIRGVFHLAAVLADATLDRQDAARFVEVLHPKLAGALALEAVTAADPLDHFVLFSSAATTLGSAGQGNYAAANAVLDAMAARRRARGLPALAVAWGVWDEVGLAVAQQNRADRLERHGLFPMAPDDALHALGEAMLRADGAELGIFDIDWGRWARAWPGVARAASLAGLVPAEAGTPSDDALAAIRAAEPAERKAMGLEAVRRVLSDVTRVPLSRIEEGRPLTALGLDSLMAMELHTRLQDRLSTDVPPSKLLALPSVGALVDLVLAPLGAPAEAVAVATEVVVLDPGIVAPPDTRLRPLENVLLTGATGFVGSHLLRQLLDQTEATVWVLARAEDETAAAEAVHGALDKAGLLRPTDRPRIVPVVGDLEQARLGLGNRSWDTLVELLDAVVHCGAKVNHMLPYEVLVPSNVTATEEVLRLAAAARGAAVHHVSTIGALPITPLLGSGKVWTEDSTLPTEAEPFFGGYAQSKLAAEHLVLAARHRGLPASIYRAGLLTGSRAMAVNPPGDAIWRIVHAVAMLGKAPAFKNGLGLTPVDVFAQAMVSLVAEPARDRSFHLFNRRETTAEDLVAAFGELGRRVELVSPKDWWAEVEARVDRSWAIYPLLPALRALDLSALDDPGVRIDATATYAALADHPITDVDRPLLVRYLEGLELVGFFQAPGARRPERRRPPLSQGV